MKRFTLLLKSKDILYKNAVDDFCKHNEHNKPLQIVLRGISDIDTRDFNYLNKVNQLLPLDQQKLIIPMEERIILNQQFIENYKKTYIKRGVLVFSILSSIMINPLIIGISCVTFPFAIKESMYDDRFENLLKLNRELVPLCEKLRSPL